MYSQEAEKYIRAGNDFYKKQQFEKAEQEYRRAVAKDTSNPIAKFNLGNTLYRLGEKDEAVEIFNRQIAGEKEPGSMGKLYYNKGVVLSSQKNLEGSIDAYKNALRQDPNDKDARENLQKALLELQKRNPPPPKKENKKNKQQQQPEMNSKEAEQKLRQLEQKEKEVQQRLQKEKAKGNSQPKDW